MAYCDDSCLVSYAAGALQSLEVCDIVPIAQNFVTGNNSNESSSPNSGTFFEGWIEPELVHPDEKYKCLVHGGLLQNAIQTSCGHRICRNCVDTLLGGAPSKMCPGGEEECEKVTLDNIFRDPGFSREIKEVKVHCYFKRNGCKKTHKLRELQAHVTSCDYRDIPCPYAARGCEETKFVRNVDDHQKKCDYRPILCEFCNLEFNAKDKQNHDKNTCPEAVVSCPYKCGEKLQRKQLEAHKERCYNKPTECQYKACGCQFTGDHNTVGIHEKDIEFHFGILSRFVFNSEIQRWESNRELRELKVSVTNLNKFIQNTDKQVKNNKKDVRLKLVSQMEHMIELDNNNLNRQLQEVKTELVQLQQSTEQLKALIPQVAGHDRLIAGHDIRMAEMDLRFQMIETANFDGKLLWKIRDFSQRKRDAVQGRTVSLYSQPFYTSHFGYKLCARVYLNGDGIARGTHMSLYFVVMRGEYDALQAWPFQNKVSLILMDQSTEKRHLKDEFFPDPSSTSFCQPVNSVMNVASGCPLFAAHTVLDNPTNQYIRDDMLFIKVVIDTTQLQLV